MPPEIVIASYLRIRASKSPADDNWRNSPFTVEGKWEIILQFLDEFILFITVIFMHAADGAVNVAAIPAQFEKGKYAAVYVVIMMEKFRSPPNKSTV